MENAAAKHILENRYYPLLKDIKREFRHYTQWFERKTVYCLYSHEDSNFIKYFRENHKGNLIHTSGGFRADINIHNIEKADIVCGYPEPSHLRSLIHNLNALDKRFILLGNINILGTQDMFDLFMEQKIFLGISPMGMYFTNYRDKLKKMKDVVWLTNMRGNKVPRREKKTIELKSMFKPNKYPPYDNCSRVVEVSVVNSIPAYFLKPMGVPVVFLDKWNPKQFEIWGLDRDLPKTVPNYPKDQRFYLNGKEMPARIVIKAI